MKPGLQIVIYLTFYSSLLFPQVQNLTAETPSISGGAEYIRELQKAIRDGNADIYININIPSLIPKKPNSIETITTFDGSNFDDNSTYNSGYVFIPPDPIGVAGNDRVISVVNCIIECRTKIGTLNWRDDLAGFFSTLTPANFTFDPKVIYDQYENRFVVVALEMVESGSNPDAGNTSRILLAVSKTSTPGSATSTDWYYHSINSKESIDVGPPYGSLDYWADYPGFAVDEEAVYVTTNLFLFAPYSGGSAESRVWIINKGVSGGLYGGGSASDTKYDPYASAGYTTTTQPSHVFGSSGAGTGIGTYLVSYSGLTDGTDEYVQVVRINNPLTTPTFSQSYINVGNIEGPTFPVLPDAPQSVSSTLVEVNDRRALHAVWRNNELWLTTTILPNSGTDAGQTTAHWFKLTTTSGGVVSYSDQGNVGGEDIASNTYTFFPSIAVNSTGDVIIGFCASASSIYPGAYYAGRFSSNPAGTVNSSIVVQAGLDYYVRTFGGSRNRWGDYTGTSIDPSDGSFWVFNEYAMARGTILSGEDGRWGTVYANVPLVDLPVELSSFTANVLQIGGVQLDWKTETEVNNYGFDVERKSQTESWTKIGFVHGHGNSNSTNSYVFTDNNISGSGKLQYRLKQIDNDGSFDYSDIVEVNITSPENYALEQNYPNPFNPSTLIKFSLPEPGLVKLKAYNLLGQDVLTLVNKYMNEGIHEVNLDMTGFPSGVYIYMLDTNGFSDTKKMIYLR